MWRRLFEEARQRSATSHKVGVMKLQPVPGEHRYAVAVQEGADLWLTLWVRRSRKGEFFIMLPRGDRDWDPHTSYHLDGTLHMKSHDHKVLTLQRRQTAWEQLPTHVDAFVEAWVCERGQSCRTERARRKVADVARNPIEQMLRLVVPGFVGRGRARWPQEPFAGHAGEFFEYQNVLDSAITPAGVVVR